MIATQGIGDLYRTYVNAQRDGIDYNLVCIPDAFRLQAKEPFDREYMQKLFDVGFEMGRKGGFWKKVPPAFEAKSRS